MTSTWFTQPPKLPALDLPGVMVTPPSGEGTLRREEIAGVAYNGLRYTYLLIPSQPGSLQIPTLTVSAQVGPGGGLASASSTSLVIAVTGSARTAQRGRTNSGDASGAAGGSASDTTRTANAKNGTANPQNASPASTTVVAQSVTVTQAYTVAPDPLITGGRITRTITQRAEGAQAMSLAAAVMDDVPHFKRYPLEPQVTTLTDGRGGFVGGQRIDRAEYVALDAGTFEFPSLSLPWRGAVDGTMQLNTVPGRSVTVAIAPKTDIPFSLADDLARLRHDARWVLPPWVLQAVAIAVPTLLLVWLTWPWWRRGVSAVRTVLHRAQARWRSSEPFYWRAWQREARATPAMLRAFYPWLRRCTGRVTMRDAVAPLDADSRSQAEVALRQVYSLDKARTDLDNARTGLDKARTGLDEARPATADPRQSSPGNLSRLADATRAWRKAWRRRAAPPSAHGLPQSLADFSSSSPTQNPPGSAP
ncbi:BatD family protein [Bordetella sp. LUAb4]|uniref:BatD family protein n=1 Tax=Bordetella sp. LUAb4 TaxID=2843195 RepID=UPI001E365ECB|nr:BatD family protein [Bordetella sp. LUAb4]